MTISDLSSIAALAEQPLRLGNSKKARKNLPADADRLAQEIETHRRSPNGPVSPATQAILDWAQANNAVVLALLGHRADD